MPDAGVHADQLACVTVPIMRDESDPQVCFADMPARGFFRREAVLPAAVFYAKELPRLSRPSRGWAKATCVFHHPDRHPSLSVNLATGGFRCFSCGAKGGDVIDFVMQRDGVDFVTAAKSLGAWESSCGSVSSADFRKQKAERERREQAAFDFRAAEKALRLRYRHDIHTLEAVQRHAAERLRDPSITIPETEECWRRMAMVVSALRGASAAYHLLCFAPAPQRTEFVQRPHLRHAAVQSVLAHGFVRDDQGRMVELVVP